MSDIEGKLNKYCLIIAKTLEGSNLNKAEKMMVLDQVKNSYLFEVFCELLKDRQDKK